jgi:hypothetical protein
MIRFHACLVLVFVGALMCGSVGCRVEAVETDTAEVIVLKPAEFAPVKLSPHGMQGFNVLASSDLERTPRNYVKVTAQVQATGECRAQLALLDFLNREHRGETVDIPAGQLGDISIDITKLDRPLAMLRAVRVYAEGKQLEVLGVEFHCAIEKLPKPDAIAQGSDDKAIQAALDALGEDGGVVHIPAGTYTINEQMTVPCDNVTIYGDGSDTILKATWYAAKPMLVVSDRNNVRITRLLFRGWPETDFRGYNEAQHAARPEDAGRKDNVMTRAVDIIGSDRIRFDHCTAELCGHAGVIVRGPGQVCVDHCFFQKNFRYGYGYGVVPCATKECYIEDTNFENHRHGVAGGRDTMASYICRFNRFVKDIKAVPDEGWKQVTSHEIDVHSGCAWLYAHDNYVEMKNGMMSAGACLRGNQGWVYRNVFINCNIGIYVVGACDDVWTWDNEFTDCPNEQLSKATGTINFDTKPANFAEIPYPHELNRLGWWPGAGEQPAEIVKAQTQFAGPADDAVLQLPETPE